MREILFRGKRVEDGEWVEGNLIIDESGRCYIGTYIAECSDGKYQIAARGFGKTINRFVGIGFIMVYPETVGQYTGRKDKNGTKIFEGDIVDASDAWWDAYGPAGHDSPIMLVEWSEFFCGFEPFANYDCDCGVYIAGNECKVIGNIHDNPELMENGGDSQPTD